MPYCPKCDMEFIDGITVCSDCGSPLMESKEAADAMKRKAFEEELKQKMGAFQAQYLAESQEMTDFEENPALENDSKTDSLKNTPRSRPSSGPYVRKSEKYDDLKSSASAFFIVGSTLTIFAVLCWLNILKLPLGLMSRIAITVLGIASLIISFRSSKDAKIIRTQIKEEEEQTKRLVTWFTDHYAGSRLDKQLLSEYGELLPEELSLKRWELIQDLLITNQDVEDPSYAELLTDEIYQKLYPDEKENYNGEKEYIR